jgi:hypothetical protein
MNGPMTDLCNIAAFYITIPKGFECPVIQLN